MKKKLLPYGLSALFGTVGGLVTIGMIVLLDKLIDFVWQTTVGINPDNPTRTLAIPVALFFAAIFVIILNHRSKGKLKGMDEIIAEVAGTGTMNWRILPRVLGTALLSIGSGASLGPEAPSAFVSASAAAFTAEKTHAPKEASTLMGLGSLSGMLGSLLNAPFVPVVMYIEGAKQKISDITGLITNTMVATAFGIGTFYALYHKLFAINIGLGTYNGSNLRALLEAFVIGIGGAIAGVVIFVIVSKIVVPAKQKLGLPMWAQTILTALMVGGLAYWLPITMFSGQHTTPTLINGAEHWSIVMLLVIGVVKIVSTNLLLDGGFFGGPIFPALFGGAAFGLAFGRLIGAPVGLAVPAAIAGLITMSLRKPLSAAILTIAVTGITTGAEVSVAVAGAMLVLMLVQSKQQEKA